MRTIFREKSYTKCDEETIPRPFSKNSKLYLCVNSLKFYTVCFYCMLSWELSKYIKTKLQTICSYLTLSFSKKQREVSLPHFLYDFRKKCFSCYNSIKRLNFIVWLPLLSGINEATKELNDIFLIKTFSYMT